MDNTVKVSLTIQLEGSTLIRKSEPEVIGFQMRKKSKGGYQYVKGETIHYPLCTKPAMKHINLSPEAYKYMTSGETPYWSNSRKWGGLTSRQRLEAHLQRICESCNGKSFSYTILQD